MSVVTRVYRSLWLGLQPWPWSLREIADAVCAEHDVDLAGLRGRRLDRAHIAARNDFMFRARAEGFTTPRIGRFLGRDHATVISGSRRHAARLAA